MRHLLDNKLISHVVKHLQLQHMVNGDTMQNTIEVCVQFVCHFSDMLS